MKTRKRLLLILLVIMCALVAKAALGADVSVVKTKHQNLFVMKVNKELEGAKVEVFYSNGDLVTAHKLGKRKLIIDFCDTKFGEYTIRVSKDDKVQEFKYAKK